MTCVACSCENWLCSTAPCERTTDPDARIVEHPLTSRGRYEFRKKCFELGLIFSYLQCPDKPNITNNVVCTSCGGVGHISRDCRVKMQYDDSGNPIGMDDRNKIDEEVKNYIS